MAKVNGAKEQVVKYDPHDFPREKDGAVLEKRDWSMSKLYGNLIPQLL